MSTIPASRSTANSQIITFTTRSVEGGTGSVSSFGWWGGGGSCPGCGSDIRVYSWGRKGGVWACSEDFTTGEDIPAIIGGAGLGVWTLRLGWYLCLKQLSLVLQGFFIYIGCFLSMGRAGSRFLRDVASLWLEDWVWCRTLPDHWGQTTYFVL